MFLRCTILPLSIVAMGCFALAADTPNATEKKQNEEWESLFNGKDLTGWQLVLTSDHKGIDPDTICQVHDGVIHVYRDVPQGAEVPIGYLASDDRYSSFHLKLQYRWGEKRFAPRVNAPRDAGILYHASDENKVWPRSVECQIQERDVGDCFTVHGAQVKAFLDPRKLKAGGRRYLPSSDGGVETVVGGPGIHRVVKSSTKEVDGWNTVEVIVRGDEEVVHLVNGHEVFRCRDLKQLDADGTTWTALKSGRLLLQAEFAEVFYRDVQIKPLDGRPFRVGKTDETSKNAAIQ